MRIRFPLAQLEQEEQLALEGFGNTNDPREEPNPQEVELTAFDHATFEKLLQHECRMWQVKLRLQDWNVKVILCRLHEMPNRDCIGTILPIMERKDAKMLVLSPTDLPLLEAGFMNDEEANYGLTIVHELLHLHLYPFTQKLTDQETVAEEQAVNALSRCLVTAFSMHKPIMARAKSTDPGNYL